MSIYSIAPIACLPIAAPGKLAGVAPAQRAGMFRIQSVSRVVPVGGVSTQSSPAISPAISSRVIITSPMNAPMARPAR